MTPDLFIVENDARAHPLRFTPPKESLMAVDLKSEAWTFAKMSEALRFLALELPATSTLRQVLTFSMVLEKISMGHDTIIAEIRDQAGKDNKGMDLLGQSIGRSYQVFLEPTKRDPDRLGWLTLETDEDDNRRKVLRLTAKGKAIALKVAKALKEKP